MTSADPGDDLVPCMRSVQLSDGDKQLMSAFKNKVSGGAPPSSSRIGGPGQNRTVVVTMPAGGASGPAVPPSQQEVPEPRKYTGGHIPSRSFQMLQQMTADDQGSAPVLARPAEGQPRRSPSHYAHGPESVTAATHSPPPPPPAPAPAAVAAGVPTCERIERERQRQEQQRRPPTNGRYAGGRNPSRAFQQLAGEYGDEAGDSREAVLGELRAVGSGQAPRPARPSAVPSRSFRRLQQEYGSQEPEPEPEPVRSGPQQTAVIRTTPEQQKQRMAAVSKTYRLLQTDPTAVPSVLGRNGR